MLRITHWRTICGIAVVAVGLSACASPSEPARTAAHGPSDTQTAEALVRIAHASLKAGDPGSAISMLKRAHEIDQGSASILAELGRTLGAVQAWSESVNAYREAAALAPKDPDIRRGYGGALLKLNELALAEVEYRAALALKEEPRTLEGLAVCLDLQGHHDEAEADFRKAYQLDPQDPAIRSNLALSLALWGKSNEAVALLAPLAAAPDATPRQRQNLALAFGLAGDLDQAAALSRLDLGETAVQNNIAYFKTLKGLSPVLRVRAIMGAETQPPLPDRRPIAAADLGADRGEKPSVPATPSATPAPHAPARAEKSASTSEPAVKPTPAKAAKAKVADPEPTKTEKTSTVQPEAADVASNQPAVKTTKPVAAAAAAAPLLPETSEPAADKAAPAIAKTDQPAVAPASATDHADADETPAAASTERQAPIAEPVGIHTYVVPTVVATWHADEASDKAPSEPNATTSEAVPPPAEAKQSDGSDTPAPHAEEPAASTALKPAS